jgi:hypothetical protein
MTPYTTFRVKENKCLGGRPTYYSKVSTCVNITGGGGGSGNLVIGKSPKLHFVKT